MNVTYRDILKSLPLDEKKQLISLTNRHGLFQLGAHLGLIGLMAAGQLALDGVLGAGALLGQGIAMCFLFCAMHEASHGTAFRTKKVNQMVALGAGFLLFMGPRWFSYFHSAHHRFTHDEARDPELMSPKPDDWRSYLFYLCGAAIWRAALVTLCKNALWLSQEPYVPEAGRLHVRREARLMMVAYGVVIGAGLIFVPSALIWFWFVPVIVGQPFLRLFLLAEHANCPHEPDMLANSRTIYTNRGLLFLSWHMSYHSAHHSFPAVPFHKLARFHEHIRAHVRQSADGYGGFHRQMTKEF